MATGAIARPPKDCGATRGPVLADLVEWSAMAAGSARVTDHPELASNRRRPWSRGLRAAEEATRIIDPETEAAFVARWATFPGRARNDAQIIGRLSGGCEGAHGVFPKCDFRCMPCYHSADANKVRVDGAHTRREVAGQMAFLRQQRGPAAYAQLIGGEVSLLDAGDHAATMRGRTGVEKPASERDLDEARAESMRRFERLRHDHGVRSYVAHNMTVTPREPR